MQKKLLYILILVGSLGLIAGAGCTQPTTNQNENQNSTNTNNSNVVVNNNTNKVVVENTNVEPVNENTNEAVENDNVNTTNNTNITDSTTVDTSDWLTYTNEEYGFSFKYPKELFANYTSEEKFPFSRTKISEAPIERLEDHFDATQRELNVEEKEIKDSVVDNKFYILLPSGIKVKTEISRAEGEALIKVFTWYDEGYQYSFTFVFPSLNSTPREFFEKYDSNEKVNKFIEQIWEGGAEKKYQEEFNLYDSVMNTLIKVK